MKTKTATIYLHEVTQANGEGSFFNISDSDMATLDNWTIIDHQKVTFALPERAGITAESRIKQLEEARDGLRASTDKEIMVLDDRIAEIYLNEALGE